MDVRYSPVTEIKWSFPRAVCIMRVKSKRGGARFSRDADELSINTVTVMVDDSPGRSRPCKERSLHVSPSVMAWGCLAPPQDQFWAIADLWYNSLVVYMRINVLLTNRLFSICSDESVDAGDLEIIISKDCESYSINLPVQYFEWTMFVGLDACNFDPNFSQRQAGGVRTY
jgi:hypothetical protein